MTAPRFDAYIRAEFIGTFEANRAGPVFTYNETYRSGAEPTPLSLSMPLASRRHTPRTVEPFLWGLLPDNQAVLRRWARQFQVSISSPLGILAAIGHDLPGAVSIFPAGVDPDLKGGETQWLEDSEVETLLVEVRNDQTAWLGDGRWSLAGAQAKIALLESDGRWGRPSGAVPTNRILKPAIEGLTDHDVNEHLCMSAANKLGLRVARTRLHRFGEERALVVDRFDRRFDPDRQQIERIHQEDMCQALGVHPALKYESEGGPSISQIAAAVAEHVDPAHVSSDLFAFIDGTIFNWLIAAPDGHAKNYSVLLHGSGVRLAPLYDVASALPSPRFYSAKVSMAMKIGGYYRAGVVGRRAWQRFADDVGVDADAVLDRAIRLSEHVADAFSDAVVDLDSNVAGTALLLDRVAEWTAQCRRSLD